MVSLGSCALNQLVHIILPEVCTNYLVHTFRVANG
jgi:hypothetical protein